MNELPQYPDDAIRRAIVAETAPAQQTPDLARTAQWYQQQADLAQAMADVKLPKWEISAAVPADQCYPRGPKIRQLADQEPRIIPGTDGVLAPPIGDAVVHVWNEFAGFAVELGGYGDISIVDPYTGRRLWVPVPDSVWDQGQLAAYRYVLDIAQQAGFWDEHTVAQAKATH